MSIEILRANTRNINNMVYSEESLINMLQKMKKPVFNPDVSVVEHEFFLERDKNNFLFVKMKKENTAIFGTTADPFTMAHLEIVKTAAKKFDKVFVVPTSVNYYRNKNVLFSFQDRIDIINEMIKDLPNVYLDTVEMNKGTDWRAIDTIKHFVKCYPQYNFHYIIGQDSYENFKTWYDYKEILKLVKLVVVQRGDYEIATFADIPYSVMNINNNFSNTSATEVRQKLVQLAKDIYLSSIKFSKGQFNEYKR